VLRFILLAILLTLVARAFWRLMDGVIAAAGGGSGGRRAQPPGVKLVRDPVCGTYVASTSSLSITSGGSTHHFCSERCREEFRKR
jgi:YHS domain-containing protein